MEQSMKHDKLFVDLERSILDVDTISEPIRNQISSAYVAFGKHVIYSWAMSKKILPMIAHVLVDLDIDSEYWSQIHRSFVRRNEMILSLVSRVFCKFDSSCITEAFCYENFGTILSSGRCLGCFASHDVDIYVSPRFRESACAALCSLQFVPKSSNSLIEQVKTEFDYFGPEIQGFGINIMWRPLSRVKLPFEVYLDDKIVWKNISRLEATHIVLPDHDLLMYLCLLHISVHSFARQPGIRLYLDIANLVHVPIDWQRIISWSRHDGTFTRVMAALKIAQKLGVPLPTWLIRTRDYSRKQWKTTLIEKIVYDSKIGTLKSHLNAFHLFFLEILASDFSVLVSITRILIPKAEWVRSYFLNGNGWLLKGYFIYWKNLFYGSGIVDKQ